MHEQFIPLKLQARSPQTSCLFIRS